MAKIRFGADLKRTNQGMGQLVFSCSRVFLCAIRFTNISHRWKTSIMQMLSSVGKSMMALSEKYMKYIPLVEMTHES